MRHSYNRFINQLKTIENLTEEYSKKEKFEIKDDFSSLLDFIILTKRAKFDYSLGLEDLESELEVASDEEKKSIKKLGQELNEIELKLKEIIKDEPVLKKAYSKISFKVSEEDDNKIVLATKNESIGLINYVFQNKKRRNLYQEQIEKKQLVFESLIVSLCTYLETFMSSMIKDFYLNIHQGELFSNSKISFKNLKEIGDLEGARIFLIETELDDLFRKNFNIWFNQINKSIDIKKIFDKDNLNIIVQEISELYLRRNLYVHADGKVSDYYLNSAPHEYTKNLKVGETLKVNKKYIEQKIDVIEKMGTMALYSHSLKKYRDPDKIFDYLNPVFLDQIKNSKNDIYSTVFKKLADKFEKHDSSHIISKINYFLSYKLREEYHLIEKEIQNYNISAYDSQYKRAIAIIMETENSIDLVLENFKTKSDDEFLYEIQWPLYDIVRDKTQFHTYVEDRLNEIFS